MSIDLAVPTRRRVLTGSRSAAGARRWSLVRIFTVGAALAALASVTTITLGGLALVRLVDARSTVTAVVTPALLSAQRLSGALVDQETGLRGFVFSGRAEFLDPYRDGVESGRRAAAELRGIYATGDLDMIGPEVEAVERAAVRWRTEYVDPVLAGPPALAGTGPAVDPELGRALFDQVRTELGALVTELETQRSIAVARTDEATTFLIGAVTAMSVVLASLLVLTAIGLQRAVLAPVSALAVQVRDVVSGGVGNQVRVSGPREFVELGEDVEAMRVHILRDLDHAQDANRRLDEQARDLARSNRDLEQFAYVASHDLQEPLRKVSSFCQLLQRRYGGRLDERADQYIEFAVDGASRMQRLINDLLAFSRVGRSTEGFVPVDLAVVAAAAAAQLDTARAEVGGKIVIGELPTVPGDAGLLRQLVTNLVGNGLKFHREGVPPVVEISARRDGDEWDLSITDNGIGIEPEYTDKVFVIFQRLHGRDVYPGTGIGLALAKKIVEFHGGRIWLDPVPDRGTTVRFTLPAAGVPALPAAGVPALVTAGVPALVTAGVPALVPADVPAHPEEFP